MATRSPSRRTKRVRKFFFFSVSILFFTTSLLFFLTSSRMFSGPSASKGAPNAKKPGRISGTDAVGRTLRFFRTMSGVDSVFSDSGSGTPEIMLRLRNTTRKIDFIDGVERYLRLQRAALVSSRVDRGAEYPVRLLVDIAGHPLLIRAGWNRKRSPALAGSPGKKPLAPQRLPGKQPRIAIVLDDAGGRTPYQWLFLGLDFPLTFAVMPDLDDSVSFARRASARGFEIILHAPMEPMDWRGMKRPPRLISSVLKTGEVRHMLDSFLASVPGAVGMNNHMGSKATGDPLLMRLVMEGVRAHRLYFIDSWTHASSRAYNAALAAGVPALKRDLFLDNRHDRQYIKERLYRLAKLAIRRGRALGIGHVTHPEMFHALKEMLPKLRGIGIRFVHASELLNDRTWN